MKSKIIKPVLFTLVFGLLLLVILLNGMPFWSIVLLTFLFILMMAGYIFFFFLNEKKQTNTIEFSEDLNTDFSCLKKISTKNHYYYNGVFYILNNEQKAISIPFNDIIELKHTLLKVNNRRIWKLIALHNNEQVEFKFRHNFTLWNKNFTQFLNELKIENPNATVGKFNLWTM